MPLEYSNNIPAMFGRVYTGAPDEVFWDMYENDATFDEASQSLMDREMDQAYVDPFDEEMEDMGFGYGSEYFPEDDTAVEKAIYQIDKPDATMTPYGPALPFEEVQALVEESPGIVGLSGVPHGFGSYGQYFDSQFDDAQKVATEASAELDKIIDAVSQRTEDEGRMGEEPTFWEAIGDQFEDMTSNLFFMPQKAYAATEDVSVESEEPEGDDTGWFDRIKDIAGGIGDFFAEGATAQAEGMSELAGGYQDIGSAVNDITQSMTMSMDQMAAQDIAPGYQSIIDRWGGDDPGIFQEMNQLLDLPPERIVQNLQEAGYSTNEISDWINSPGWNSRMIEEGNNPAITRSQINAVFPGADVTELDDTLTYGDVYGDMYEKDRAIDRPNILDIVGAGVSVFPLNLFQAGKIISKWGEGLSEEQKEKVRNLQTQGYDQDASEYIVSNNITAESAGGAIILNRLKIGDSPEQALEFWKNMEFPGDITGLTPEQMAKVAGSQKTTPSGTTETPSGTTPTTPTSSVLDPQKAKGDGVAGEVTGTTATGKVDPKAAAAAADADDDTSQSEKIKYEENLKKTFYKEMYSRPGGSRSDVAGELPNLFGQTKTLFWLLYGSDASKLVTQSGEEPAEKDRETARNSLESMYGEFLNSYLANPQQYRSGKFLADNIARVNVLLKKWETDKDTSGWNEADEQDWTGWVQPFFSNEATNGYNNRANLIHMSITDGRQGRYSNLIHQSANKTMNHYRNLGMSEQEIFERMTRVFGTKPQEPDATKIDPATGGKQTSPAIVSPWKKGPDAPPPGFGSWGQFFDKQVPNVSPWLKETKPGVPPGYISKGQYLDKLGDLPTERPFQPATLPPGFGSWGQWMNRQEQGPSVPEGFGSFGQYFDSLSPTPPPSIIGDMEPEIYGPSGINLDPVVPQGFGSWGQYFDSFGRKPVLEEFDPTVSPWMRDRRPSL